MMILAMTLIESQTTYRINTDLFQNMFFGNINILRRIGLLTM